MNIKLTKRKDAVAISHHGPDQTSPEIYADHIRYPHGSVNTGSHVQWAILADIKGSATCTTEHNNFVVSSGDIVICRPRTWHSWRAGDMKAYDNRSDIDSCWEIAYAAFHPYPHWTAWLDAFEYDRGFALLHLTEDAWQAVSSSFVSVADIFHNGGAMRDEWTLHALQGALLTLSAHTVHKRTSGDKRIDSALEILHASYGEDMSFPELARRVGLSAPHFSTLFSRVVGVPPVTYLEQIRLGYAAELLRYSHKNVATIARETGYADPFYFARRFRSKFEQSPSEYRQAARSSEGTEGATKDDTPLALNDEYESPIHN